MGPKRVITCTYYVYFRNLAKHSHNPNDTFQPTSRKAHQILLLLRGLKKLFFYIGLHWLRTDHCCAMCIAVGSITSQGTTLYSCDSQLGLQWNLHERLSMAPQLGTEDYTSIRFKYYKYEYVYHQMGMKCRMLHHGFLRHYLQFHLFQGYIFRWPNTICKSDGHIKTLAYKKTWSRRKPRAFKETLAYKKREHIHV